MASSTPLNDFSLDGKVAAVIGAERAVGRECARALAEAGAAVLIASQDPGSATQLKAAAEAVRATGHPMVVCDQDAAARSDLRSTIDMAVRDLGGLDIVVNAIDSPFYAPDLDADEMAFDRVIGRNLKSLWMACQEACRAMKARSGGVIVNLTSILAERGVPHAALYCAAKAGVLNLTRALALEYARSGIRLNVLETGWLDEEASAAAGSDEFSKRLLRYLPYTRLVKPEELGGALVYLVSPAAGFVTGESIAVDGGVRCRV